MYIPSPDLQKEVDCYTAHFNHFVKYFMDNMASYTGLQPNMAVWSGAIFACSAGWRDKSKCKQPSPVPAGRVEALL